MYFERDAYSCSCQQFYFNFEFFLEIFLLGKLSRTANLRFRISFEENVSLDYYSNLFSHFTYSLLKIIKFERHGFNQSFPCQKPCFPFSYHNRRDKIL